MTHVRLNTRARDPTRIYHLAIGGGHLAIAWGDTTGWVTLVIIVEVILALAYWRLVMVRHNEQPEESPPSASIPRDQAILRHLIERLLDRMSTDEIEETLDAMVYIIRTTPS